ncbi:MAG: hypothetical protein HOQ27_16370 [Dermatophilaceae bacterium]|nr:hypothetical protein [Dermatophilaceae bacterium]
MSDTGKLVLWIAVAVVVIGIIVWLFVNAGRRREVEARRFEAGELRARVEERRPEVQGSQDRASVTAAMAQDARAEAERTAAEAKQRADEARRLEQQAAHHAAAADSASAEHADLERQADRVDPDVRTDDEGYRLDEDGDRLPGQEASSRQRSTGAAGAGAAGAVAAGAGAATFAAAHDDDDEDDLADAENPFASAASTGSEGAEAHDEESAQGAGRGRYEEPAWEPSDPGVGHSRPATSDKNTSDEPAATEAAPATADAGAGYAEGEPGDAGADSDDTVEGDPVDEQTNDEVTAQHATDQGDRDRVDVPALEGRDDVIAEGGTPTEDPGDHRGQPWATTPGQRGPEESDEPADEGRDVDMAPHSHESDEVSDVDEPAGSTSEEPRRQEAQPASDVADAAYPDEDGDSDRMTAGTSDSAGDSAGDSADTQTQTGDTAYAGGSTDDSGEQASPSPVGRRVSEFDEVVDGGFGLGSAAPIDDGAQPLGHAIKGTREGATFLGPDDEGYDDAEPDVWFYNEEAARRAGFTKRGE